MAGFGGKIELQGANEYKKSISEINSQLRLLSSEMKLTASAFDNGDKSSKNLTKQMDLQKEKITKIKDALQMAKEKYGENSKEVNNWKAKLNDAEAELNGLNKELEDSSKKTSVFSEVLKANLTSEVIIGGIKSLASAIKEVGGALLNIGKQSVESYAQFEQLEGGVKKLFGEDAQSVINNANNAFKTAGMSANEYMDTVTSFSASLISSLDGDTAKATEIANMAISDMSDNANTFGTDMVSIQNAYQGFAKGNYTMLDNLKLGFAGSKEGMQSLLDKAEEISGRKFDISSFSDISEAIHIMQEEMNIAGTTAREASTTIEGSLNSTKSAWQNLLTGLAGNGENLSQLINNLVDSVITAGDNILPVVEIIVDSVISSLPQIVEKINENLPRFLEKGIMILQKLLDGINQTIPQLLPIVIQLVGQLSNFIVQNLPTIINSGIQILLAVCQGISESLPDLIPVLIDAVLTICDTLIDNIDLVIEAGIQLIIGLSEGLIKALPKLIEKAPILIDKLVNKLTDTSQIAKIVQTAGRLIVELGAGLIKAIPSLLSAIPQIISSLITGFSNQLKNMNDIGKNLIKGIMEGFSNFDIGSAIKKTCSKMLSGIKSFFGIHSPSVLFKEQIGTNLALGLGEGFEDTMSDVTKDMTDAIPTNFDTGINLSTSSALGNSSLEFGIDYSKLAYELKDALNGMNIILNDEKMGEFVVRTVEREVYS